MIVFAGPTLYGVDDLDARLAAIAEGAGAPGARFELRPPAGRGDLLAAVAGAPCAIVLLDGVYFTVPAVTHKEILYAMEAGVPVIGAASLGALRAAELERFGMEGIGWVFARFREGALTGDDEVAVLHAAAEQGYRSLTVALVEVRHALAALVAEGELGPAGEAGAGRVIAGLQDLAFTARTPERVQELAVEHLGADAARALNERLVRPGEGVKWADAEIALTRAARIAARPEASPPVAAGHPGREEPTEFALAFREDHLRPAPGAPTYVQAWRAVQLLHPGAPALAADLRRQFLLASAAREAGLAPAPERIAAHEREIAALGSALPARETTDEARSRALAEAAGSELGGPEGALADLAARFGLERSAGAPRDPEAALLELVTEREAVLPTWFFARALATSPIFAPALAAAAAITEVRACFVARHGDGPLDEGVLRQVAAELWGCCPTEAEAEGVRRALLPGRGQASGYSPGLYGALAWIAPAHRLPRAINDYPEAKVLLRDSTLRELAPRLTSLATPRT